MTHVDIFGTILAVNYEFCNNIQLLNSHLCKSAKFVCLLYITCKCFDNASSVSNNLIATCSSYLLLFLFQPKNARSKKKKSLTFICLTVGSGITGR